MRNTLITLAEIHHDFGFIGFDEFNERIHISLWLSDELKEYTDDPRVDSEDSLLSDEINESEENDLNNSVLAKITDNTTQKQNNENWLEFLCLGLWVFTKSDPDSYPSVPHGHFKSQNNKWPKLNPYTGRVFTSKHQEDRQQRLTKEQMKTIWSDEKFKSFCREMIIWYQEKFPYYDFPVRRPYRMPNP